MSATFEIICPSAELDKDQRVQECLAQMGRWVVSEPFRQLVCREGGKLVTEKTDIESLKANLEYLKASVLSAWDYRKGKERFEVEAPPEIDQLVCACAAQLGYCDSGDVEAKVDYCVALGGTLLGNYMRARAAAYVKAANGDVPIVGLSAWRPIGDKERKHPVNALDAQTEYQSLGVELEKVFSLGTYRETVNACDNANLTSAWRTYADGTLLIAAPSSDPENRRANTEDQLNYLFENLDIAPKSKLCLVTTDRYRVPQLCWSLDAAMRYGVEIATVGSGFLDRNDSNGVSEPLPAWVLLEEVKKAVNAIASFTLRYA